MSAPDSLRCDIAAFRRGLAEVPTGLTEEELARLAASIREALASVPVDSTPDSRPGSTDSDSTLGCGNSK